MNLILFCVFLTFSIGLFLLLAGLLRLPTLKTSRVMMDTGKEGKQLSKTLDAFYMDGAVKIAKYIEPILQDGRIRKFKDRECWFCTSLEDALRLMELTVMEEGKLYYDANGLPRRYPKFVPEEYVVLELSPRYQNGDWVIWNQEFPGGAPEEIRKLGEEFSHLKIGFRGDLRFYENPNIYEVAELFQEQTQTPQITM